MARYILLLFSLPISKRKRRAHGERGQVLMLTAGLLPILLGMTALAIDLGAYSSHRRTLQNAADSIALAAAQELPDPTAANASARTWAAKNSTDPGDMTVTVLPVSASSANPTVRVTIERPHEFSFARVLGIDSHPVAATAVAVKTTPGGGGNLVPFAITQAFAEASTPGSLVTLKYDANDPTAGNFGLIRLDGGGGSNYLDTLKNGSSSSICVLSATDCTDTSPVCDGSTCPSQTGNLIGATRTGVDYRIDNTDAHCDTFGEAFSGPVDGEYGLNSPCNPWLSTSYPSLRVIIVPVIASLCNGTCDYQITEFSLFWLEGYAGGRCTGSSCEIEGRFVDANVNIGLLGGTFNPLSSIHFTKLIE